MKRIAIAILLTAGVIWAQITVNGFLAKSGSTYDFSPATSFKVPSTSNSTITLANSFTTAGNNPLTLTTTGTTNVTFPLSGTLATTGNLTFTSVTGGVGFQNGFADLGGANQITQYGKDSNGNVYLRGMVNGGSSTGTVIFTLPAGFRPLATNNFVILLIASVATELTIHSDGTVNLTGATTSNLSLAGVVFSVN